MAEKTKTDKRGYERDTPVSLRPLDLRTALAGLLKVNPSGSTAPSKPESPRPEKSSAPAKPGCED